MAVQESAFKRIARKVTDVYSYFFARKVFYPMNWFIFHLSLRGIGIGNHHTEASSGESHFLKTVLRDLDQPVVFDVGGNEGNYSAEVMKLRPKARVFTFEPHPLTFQRLLKRLGPSGVTITNAACGRTPGQMTLYDHTGEGSGHASLYQGAIEDIQRRPSQAYPVSVIDLDAFAGEHNIERIDLLKIDTEGHELEVLSGAQRLLREKRIRAIQFEFNSMNVISRTFFKDFYTALPGYAFYRLLRGGWVRLPPYSTTQELFAFQNIVAIPLAEGQ